MVRVRRVLIAADVRNSEWLYAEELTGGLSMLGTDVCFAALGSFLSPSQRAVLKRYRGVQVVEANYELPVTQRWEKNNDSQYSFEFLPKIAEQQRVDIAHLANCGYAAQSWPVPTVAVTHPFDSLIISSANDVNAGLLRRGLRNVSAVAAPSSAVFDLVSQKCGQALPGGPVYLGFSSPLYEPGAKQDFIMANAGTVQQSERLHRFSKIGKRTKWPVFVAGDFAADWLQARDLRGLTTLGYLRQESLARWYSRAQFILSPLPDTSLDYSVIHAALCGCVPVLADLPESREVWEGAAVLVAPDDLEQFASIIDYYSARPAERRRLQIRARNRALCYSRERMARKYYGLYQRLLAREAFVRVRLGSQRAKS